MFRLGLIINPAAGIGGPLGLKGSDCLPDDMSRNNDRAGQRVGVMIAHLATGCGIDINDVVFYCYEGLMGMSALAESGFTAHSIGRPGSLKTSADDTKAAAQCLRELPVDLILFAGGDGTARDICALVADSIPVLGIPAGVKMHSGVYAVSPTAAAEIVAALVHHQLVDISSAEVRDIDEAAFRGGIVRSKFYGELLVPRLGHFLQHTKVSGQEVEALVLDDIAADVIESMTADTLYLIGPGTTPLAVTQAMGLAGTLLGFDAVLDRQILAQDLNEQQMLALLAEHHGPVKILITAIGGQGHILGRGNQQLSPLVLKKAGLDSVQILATKTKLKQLQGRPLLVDSGDRQLDLLIAGYKRVITGYHDSVMFAVEAA